MAKRTIYVLRISRDDLQKHWNIPVPYTWDWMLYIRCTKDMKVNWEKNPVYSKAEISCKEEFKILNLPYGKTYADITITK